MWEAMRKVAQAARSTGSRRRRGLQAQLRAAGLGIGRSGEITTNGPHPADIASVRTGRAAVLGTHRPASTLIIGGLSNPAWKVEVEGIAVA